MFCTVDRAYPMTDPWDWYICRNEWLDFYGKCSYINIPYSHPMGIVWYCIVVDFPLYLRFVQHDFWKGFIATFPFQKKHMLFFMRFYADQRWSPTRPQPRKASHQTLFPNFKTHSFPWHQPSYCQNTISRGGGPISSLAHIVFRFHMGVSKNRGTPKWDGENNGKPY